MINRSKDFTALRLSLLKNPDYQVITQLIHAVASFTAQEKKKISAEADKIQSEPEREDVDKAWLIDMLGEDNDFLDDVKRLSQELAIVGLYKKVEISTKRAIEIAYPDKNNNLLFKIKELQKYLKNKGINIRDLPNYPGMDETRCISNDIKHNGTVGKELAAYPNWEKGESLNGLDAAYDRLAPCCSLYMDELLEAIIKQVKASG